MDDGGSLSRHDPVLSRIDWSKSVQFLNSGSLGTGGAWHEGAHIDQGCG